MPSAPVNPLKRGSLARADPRLHPYTRPRPAEQSTPIRRAQPAPKPRITKAYTPLSPCTQPYEPMSSCTCRITGEPLTQGLPCRDCEEGTSYYRQNISNPTEAVYAQYSQEDADVSTRVLLDTPVSEYLPRKPVLAAANDEYAKDLVRQSVLIIQRLWSMPPDPPLPSGAHLPGHLSPPSPPHFPPPPPPPPAIIATQANIDAQEMLTPPQQTYDTSIVSSNTQPPQHIHPPHHLNHQHGPVAQPPAYTTIPHHAFHAQSANPQDHGITFGNNLLFFVHEILRRSRTTCSTLEVAMCYVVAVCHAMRRLRHERDNLVFQAHQRGCHPAQLDRKHILTSPLFDPRRTFLASLVLASKFHQDRAYSNKAWAKLSGLSALEVSRCERALGDALQWRLWVGRDVQIASPSDTNLGTPSSIGLGAAFPLASTPTSPPPSITPAEGIIAGGRCLSPPTTGISADMLEEELYQEEQLQGGVHSVHGPNALPGEGDIVARSLMATAARESRRTPLKPMFYANSSHPSRFEPTQSKTPTSCQATSLPCALGTFQPCAPSSDTELDLMTDQDEQFGLSDWLVEHSLSHQGSDSQDTSFRPTSSPASTQCSELDYDTASFISGFGPSTARSTPWTSPQSVISDYFETMDDEDINIVPSTPKAKERILPIACVVGAFRPPRTPIPSMSIPATDTTVEWEPPVHLLTNPGAYTPPTDYCLLTPTPTSEPPPAPSAPAPLALALQGLPSMPPKAFESISVVNGNTSLKDPWSKLEEDSAWDNMHHYQPLGSALSMHGPPWSTWDASPEGVLA